MEVVFIYRIRLEEIDVTLFTEFTENNFHLICIEFFVMRVFKNEDARLAQVNLIKKSLH